MTEEYQGYSSVPVVIANLACLAGVKRGGRGEEKRDHPPSVFPLPLHSPASYACYAGYHRLTALIDALLRRSRCLTDVIQFSQCILALDFFRPIGVSFPLLWVALFVFERLVVRAVTPRFLVFFRSRSD